MKKKLGEMTTIFFWLRSNNLLGVCVAVDRERGCVIPREEYMLNKGTRTMIGTANNFKLYSRVYTVRYTT